MTQHAQQVQRIGVVRLLPQHLPVDRLRLRRPTAAVMLQRGFHRRSNGGGDHADVKDSTKPPRSSDHGRAPRAVRMRVTDEARLPAAGRRG